ncbi:MAG: hypothetical protein BWY06_01522 [Candidatus Latescibacteria bacterium ADurb.Bin168]|nr:MAG: hypothetical protein BWY06_01522 [Candidatus Latescibacteria bacterium ADurb.Bin168]
MRVVFHDIVPALVEDGCRVFRAECHRKGTERFGLPLDILLVRVVHEFDAHAAGDDVAEKMRPLPYRIRITALPFDHLRLQAAGGYLLLEPIHELREIRLFDHMVRKVFLCLFYEVQFAGIGFGTVEALHGCDILRAEMLGFITQELPRTGVDMFRVPARRIRIAYVVMRVHVVVTGKFEGETAAEPVVFRFVPRHVVSNHSEQVEEVAESGKRTKAHTKKLTSVRAAHDELALLRFDAAVEDDCVYIKASIDLRHLARLAIAERRVADFRHFPKAVGHLVTDHQVAHERFTVDNVFLGQAAPWSNDQAPALHVAFNLLAPFGAEIQVVLNAERLAVHGKRMVVGLFVEQIEHVVHELEHQQSGFR